MWLNRLLCAAYISRCFPSCLQAPWGAGVSQTGAGEWSSTCSLTHRQQVLNPSAATRRADCMSNCEATDKCVKWEGQVCTGALKTTGSWLFVTLINAVSSRSWGFDDLTSIFWNTSAPALVCVQIIVPSPQCTLQSTREFYLSEWCITPWTKKKKSSACC